MKLIAKADGIILDNNSYGIIESKKILNNEFLFGTNSAENSAGYDFCTTNNISYTLDIPTFYKTKEDKNLIFYEAKDDRKN